MSIRTLLRALWIGCILFGAGILPASAQTRRVILHFDGRSELPGTRVHPARTSPY